MALTILEALARHRAEFSRTATNLKLLASGPSVQQHECCAMGAREAHMNPHLVGTSRVGPKACRQRAARSDLKAKKHEPC